LLVDNAAIWSEQMNTILITGANGMVGQALIRLLVDDDSNIIKALTYPGETLFLPDYPRLEIIKGDINSICWTPLLEGVETVVHLAARVHVFDKRKSGWEQYYQTNVVATKKLCLQAVKANIKKFVFISTVGVYGDYPQLDESGELIIAPQNDYARSKLMAEAELVNILGGRVPYLIFRPVMMYGPGDRGNMGRMIRAIEDRRFVIPGSGSNKKSALYVEDFARIIVASLEDDSLCNETIIVSNMNVISLREMCDIISRKVAKGWQVPSIPLRLLDIIGRVGDYLKIVPVDSATVKKLTIDSDYSEYSIVQKRLGINEETALEQALEKMGY
jgi:nucleoside-diphosphate-sugar epimerase